MKENMRPKIVFVDDTLVRFCRHVYPLQVEDA
jgi:hypothetical protein